MASSSWHHQIRLAAGCCAGALSACAYASLSNSTLSEGATTQSRPAPSSANPAASEARVAFPAPREWSREGPFGAAQSAAAECLRRDGCVVLCSSDGKSTRGLMAGLDSRESSSFSNATDATAAAAAHLRGAADKGAADDEYQLLDRAAARASLDSLLSEVAAATGQDPREEQFEFVEVYHRSRLRYDVSSPPAVMTLAFSDLLDSLVVPIIAKAYITPETISSSREQQHSGTAAAGAASAAQPEAEAQVKTLCDGVVTSLPGAPAQQFHADGPRGIVTVFVPLVDCELTGTEFWLRSHTSDLSQVVAATGALDDSCPRWINASVRRLCEAMGVGAAFAAPRLRRGDVLIFDYRIIHRGRAHPLHQHHRQHRQHQEGINEEQEGVIIESSDANELRDRPILYRTFFWGGDAEGVHEGPGGLNWPTRRLSDGRSDDEGRSNDDRAPKPTAAATEQQ